MDKNTHTKKKHLLSKTNSNDILIPKEELHEDIALVTQVCGNSTFKVTSSKGISSTAFLPGKFKKNNAKRINFVSLSSIVLIAFRHFQTDIHKHSDILHVYSTQHVLHLHSFFPKFFNKHSDDVDNEILFI
jgi:translation initiation factor IF-1